MKGERHLASSSVGHCIVCSFSNYTRCILKLYFRCSEKYKFLKKFYRITRNDLEVDSMCSLQRDSVQLDRHKIIMKYIYLVQPGDSKPLFNLLNNKNRHTFFVHVFNACIDNTLLLTSQKMQCNYLNRIHSSGHSCRE